MPAPELPVVDSLGDTLVALSACAEHEVHRDGPVPCPLAVVVASSPSGVLFGMNRWRRRWELLGGVIEPDETPRQAAAREFTEESGMPVDPSDLSFAGIATFDLTNPHRRELAAVFSLHLENGFGPQENHEISAFRWDDALKQGAKADPETGALDHAIAQWVRCTAAKRTVTLTGLLVCADDAQAGLVSRLLPEHIALTRTEPGCLSFDVVRTPDPLVWQVDERFRNEDAFDAHQDRVAASEWGVATAAIERRYTVRRPE